MDDGALSDMIDRLRRDMSTMRARLFQLIEAAGLPEHQEHALKGCIRTASYDAQATLEASLREGA